MIYVKVNRWTGFDVSRAGVLLTNRIKKSLKNIDGINYKYISSI